ncbi:MAG: tetratricopeptide repeat protein [Desulfopila sp.]|jgi:tetratricopeptide (TPR) repeat protein|nr:tetratricopeptide repeat protein [Desulfopila sp.]
MQSQKQLASLECLQEKDFRYFYSSFKEIVRHNISHFENLFFLFNIEDCRKYIQPSEILTEVEVFFSAGQKRSAFRSSINETVIISLSAENGDVLAVITGVDPYFANHVSVDWLAGLSKTLEHSFLLVKRAGMDLDTGLLNSKQFYRFPLQLDAREGISVLLVELYPRARTSRESRMHCAKASRSLRSCLAERFPLFYLGHHLFAVVVTNMESKDFTGFGRKMMSWLRRDGFRKIHIGVRRMDSGAADSGVSASEELHQAAEQALLALDTARKRGPVSLCDYEQIHHPENHPLQKPSKSLLAKMRRRWQDVDTFSILLLRLSTSDSKGELVKRLPEENLVCENGDIFLFLPNTKPMDALQWVQEKAAPLHSCEVQIGVASYPYITFSKSQTVFNSRKAFHHAGFFGSAGSAIFDAVSLNISGDIYYAEGDLTSAIKEYKAGLMCNPEDTNLLNSMGVAYADMDKHKEAHRCFEQVLAIEDSDFMALYNAGIAAERIGNMVDAIQYFEKASQLDTEFTEVKDDLVFHLGRLYCLVGKNQKAVETLLPWYQKEDNSKAKEQGLTVLGKAYHALGRYEEAMRWLQKALAYNEFDAESMGLLGYVYLVKKEGDEIALTLCERSVDLEPKNLALKLYFARAQIACGYYSEARKTISKCLRNKKFREEAALLSSLNDKQEGLLKRAKKRLEKLLENAELDKKIKTQAILLKEEIDGIQ